MKFKFEDNSPAVKAAFAKAVGRTLNALGMKWQEIVTMEIDSMPRFGKLKDTGAMGAVDTGRMRASMEYTVDKGKKEVTVGSIINYALYVTYGTWKMPRRPFFQNSGFNYDREYEKVAKDNMHL